MELRHLRYFIAVAEAEHFGRAAKQLHISQSPLSRQIAQLEEEIGVELFVPSGRGIKLSVAGRAFLEGARATVTRANLAVDDARAAARGRIGKVVLGFEGGLAFGGLLPKVVRSFRARHPQAEVRILPVESEDQVAALRDGTISVGYGYHLPEEDPLVRCRVLFRDRLGVVLPRRHRLASRRTLRIADLKDERFIWGPRERNPRIFDAVISAFRAQGQTLQLETVQEAEDGEAFLTLVASGEGLSFFAESTAEIIRIAAVLKRVRDLDVAFLGRSVWLAASEKDPLIASLLEITNSVHGGRSHAR